MLRVHLTSQYPDRRFIVLCFGSRPQASTSAWKEKEKGKLQHITSHRSRPSFQAHLPNRKPSAGHRFRRHCEGVSRSRDPLSSSER
jgi:hypothetical protein